MRHLANVRFAAIGPATVDALAEFHLKTDVQPDTFRAEALAEALAPQVSNCRVLLLRASRGREVLADMLNAAGATVEQVVVYESRDVLAPAQEIADALAAGRIDFTTVTSSAIVRSLAKMFGDSLRNSRLVAISPLTAEVLEELGYPATIVVGTYTCEGLVSAILATVSGNA